ncbi:MAG: ATP-dependent Clp protease ATP-binding subunit [Lentisphaerae bacterium]|jgi:hypothetical protein|nr:ATP-dependent Clp protease ATP-binding subunit [Lentisphaerota bacterium]MBT4816879.1 ATP-dependent Clp protease ATP-binding subunit [Lentisphaerota bacterium]MBT5608085.1 ATP-dependent Clp protease ATP-binding subunit [Lentisphaerota bacterium]MBT7057605.1 ATP-dependent Clp protease ATP-binding subunit [Lentisphaerota bacterium]MBT7840232.1 ATP-dependent Clp protease ATP-binding subunit [Lentisphaerota bacterium]
MQQFLNGSNTAWAELETRVKGRCIRFRDQEMPQRASPRHAHVGFEVEPGTAKSILYVQYGVACPNASPEVEQWFTTGEKHFPDFQSLRAWVQRELASVYSASAGNERSVSDLTDMQAIRDQVADDDGPLFIDEDDLLQQLKRLVRGQDDALSGMVRRVCRHCARSKPTRPAVLFEVGPTGVGKTRAAESLAKCLRRPGTEGSRYGFVRLDMSEYQEQHRVSQLLGAPQGYVGYGEGSQLLDALANPRTVVLFDEIEKAHPAVLRALMNAMDAGRLSTAGRTNGSREIDCRQAIFIFTSNLEASDILKELADKDAFGVPEIEDEVCRRRLRSSGVAPEIIGRIGRFLVFRPLTPEIRAEILALSIVEVAAEYDVAVERIEPSVVIDILGRLKSASFGARPAGFLIDELLGGCFSEVAARRDHTCVEVVGPPFRCTPVSADRTDEEKPEQEDEPTPAAEN